MINKYSELIKDTFVFAIGSLGSKLILFFLVPLYTNYLTTDEYGTSDLIFTFSSLIMPFVTLVISEAVVRFGISKSENQKDVIKTAFVFLMASISLLTIIVPLLNYYNLISPWKWYLYLYILFSMILEIERNYLKVKNLNKLFAALSIAQTFTLALTNVFTIVYLNMGIRGYLISNIVSVFIIAIVAFFSGKIYCDLKEGSFDKQLLKRMLMYSSPLVINNLSWWIIHSSDKIMIQLMINASVLGLYTAATKIPSLINVIVSIFSQSWGISSIKEIERNSDSSFITNVYNAYTILVFGASIFVIAIIKPFMKVYVGESFYSSWRLVPLLISAAAFYSVATFFASIYLALKKSVNNMITTLVCALVNIIFNFIFIKLLGIWGALIGTISAYFILAQIRVIDIKRYIKLDINVIRYTFNSCILIIYSILVSLNFHIKICTLITIILYAFCNAKIIINVILVYKKKKTH